MNFVSKKVKALRKTIKQKGLDLPLAFWTIRHGLRLGKNVNPEVMSKSLMQNEEFRPFERSWLKTIKLVLKWCRDNNVEITEYSFVDIGSGDGIVCCYVASKLQFKEFLGIELSPSLFHLSQINRHLFLRKFGDKSTKLNFVNMGLEDFVPSKKKTIYFCFNSVNSDIIENWIYKNIDLLKESKLFWSNDAYLRRSSQLWKFRKEFWADKLISIFHFDN
jgi:hypothetical protein